MSDKITTLSQAIRVGSTYRPQIFGIAIGLLPGLVYGSCAIGAALEAISDHATMELRNGLKRPIVGFEEDLEKRFGPFKAIKKCPGCKWKPYGQHILGIIAHLNDEHGWRRERIANWVEEQGY